MITYLEPFTRKAPLRKFNNKRVVLTGAASGVGREIALLLAASKAHLILIDIQQNALEKTAEECQKLSPKVDFFTVDITNSENMHTIAENIQREGAVDFVFANAGVGGINPGDNFSLSINKKIMDVNFYGAVNSIIPFLPLMLKNRSGHIIATSSLASLRGLPGGASYSASKAALNNFIESLRIDLKSSGIRVTNILPGFLKTAMTNHDEFPLPFLLDAKTSAKKIIAATDKRKITYMFPFPMAMLALLNKFIPDFLYIRMHLLIQQVQNKDNGQGQRRQPKIF